MIRRLLIITLLVVLFICGSGMSGLAHAATRASTCQSYDLPVALAAGLPRRYTIYGELCTPSTGPSSTVQLLVPGGTYNHIYWDFPTIDDVSYSYVQAANASGYSTFNIDQIATGESSHPDLALVTVTLGTGAFVIHQIVQDLLHGQVGTQSFARVLLVGHSLGSIAAMLEASNPAYRDVAGVILTGMLHHPDVVFLATVFATLYLAALDPRFAGQGYGPSYIVTEPGTREHDFYYAPNTDPNVVAEDEATKDVSTLGEFETFLVPLILAYSVQITVPVLLVVGQQDNVFCGLLATDCSSAATVLRAEAPYYSPKAQLQVVVVPGSGHDLNLQPGHNASGLAVSPAWFASGLAWAHRYVAP